MAIDKKTLRQRARELLENMWNSVLLFRELPVGKTSNPKSELFLLEHTDTGAGVRHRPTRIPLSSILTGGGGSDTSLKRIVSGGAVWSGQGMTFWVDVIFEYFGITGSALAEITLNDGDDDFPRFDLIAVEVIDGVGTIVVIEGVPAEDPIVPFVAENQIAIQPVLVTAQATTPQIDQTIVYSEANPDEWIATTYDLSGVATGTINTQSTDNPYSGQYCLQAILNPRRGIRFSALTAIDFNSYIALVFFVRLPAPLPPNRKLLSSVGLGGTAVGNVVNFMDYGLDRTKTTWQQIIIPTSLYSVGASYVDRIHLRMEGTGSLQTEFFLDYIVFSTGIPLPPDDPIDLSMYVKKDGSTPFEARQKGVAAVEPNELVTLEQLQGITDLGDWEGVTVPPGAWWGVDKGSGKWVIVGNTKIIVSVDDGVNWVEASTIGTPINLRSVRYGNGVWMAVSASTDSWDYKIWRSTDDGSSWQPVAGTDFEHQLSSIRYHNGTWIAVGLFAILKSDDDGDTWTVHNVPGIFQDVDSDGSGNWISVSTTTFLGNIAVSTDDGDTWTMQGVPENVPYAGVKYANSTWVIVGYNGKIMRSTDGGATWTLATVEYPNQWLKVTHAENFWIAVANTQSNSVARSFDNGATWQTMAVPFQHSWHNVHFADGTGIAVSGGLPAVMRFAKISLGGYVKQDGSTPIYNPQQGVPGVAPNDFVVMSQIGSQGGVGKYIISGGAAWSGTALIYSVSDVHYRYYDDEGTTAATTVTLDNGDAEDRFDIICVDASTNTIKVVKGAPDVNPIFPLIPEEYIALQPVSVKANATTPDVNQEIVYLNHVEWNTSTSGGMTGTVDFDSTNSPVAGSVCVAIDGCKRATTIHFKKPSGNVLYTEFSLLSLYIRVRSNIPAGTGLVLRNRKAGNNSGSAVNLKNYGFNAALKNSWQLIVIPTSLFNAPYGGNELSLQMQPGNVNLLMDWDIDNISLSDGLPPPAPPGAEIDVLENGVLKATTDAIDFVDGEIIKPLVVYENNKAKVKFNIGFISDGFGGLIQQVDAATYNIILHAPYNGVLTEIVAKLETGDVDIKLQIGSVDVVGSSLSVSSVKSSSAITADNVFSEGDLIKLVLYNPDNDPESLDFMILFKRSL